MNWFFVAPALTGIQREGENPDLHRTSAGFHPPDGVCTGITPTFRAIRPRLAFSDQNQKLIRVPNVCHVSQRDEEISSRLSQQDKRAKV
jgi:hypothetical protein